jgi:hypothetical protein
VRNLVKPFRIIKCRNCCFAELSNFSRVFNSFAFSLEQFGKSETLFITSFGHSINKHEKSCFVT